MLEKIEQLEKLVKEYKRELKKRDKVAERKPETPKQYDKQEADLNHISMYLMKLDHQIHAVSVDLGFAEVREHYNEITLTTGWHEFCYQPPKPECFKGDQNENI